MKQEEEEKKNKKKKKGGARAKEDAASFEFCKVCRLNHKQGRKHKYIPNHAKAVTAVLNRFHTKLSHLRSSLNNPSHLLHPNHASPDRLWCVFCDADVTDLGSSFACGNAIYHLASPEHLKNMKDFLWKHGGGMGRADSFRVSEADLVKWEKKCASLKSAALSSQEMSGGALLGSSKDIHHVLRSDDMISSRKDSIYSYNPSVSCGVMPLQNLTTEVHSRSQLEGSGIRDASPIPNVGTYLLEEEGMPRNMSHQTGGHLNRGSDKGSSVSFLPSNRMDRGMNSIEECTQGNQSNEHFGNLPPWLEVNESCELSPGRCKQSHVNNASSSTRTGKSQKLNPKRVGAAWAEKRRAELEMEQRGEILSTYDPNWLPNFGRVWQAGTRKESRKEFEKEKQKSVSTDNQHDRPLKIQPYMSKRAVNPCSQTSFQNSYLQKRMNSGENDNAVNGHVDGFDIAL